MKRITINCNDVALWLLPVEVTSEEGYEIARRLNKEKTDERQLFHSKEIREVAMDEIPNLKLP
jgi:hypothetical protein